MNVRHWAFALTLALAAPSFSWAQGFAGLATDAEGFRLPEPNPSFSFPDDHGPHPDYRIEWWYITANLEDAEGRDYGIQWTLFRAALGPGEEDGWLGPQLWFAHAGLTTEEEHYSAERLARGGIGQAGVRVQPFSAWIDDWQMTARASGGDALNSLRLTASAPDFAYDLALSAEGPLIRQGRNGFSVKSLDGHASYYYSQPFYRLEGTLELPAGPVVVTGEGWLDREWSSQPLSEDQSGWDWVSLHLDDGDKLMVYRLRGGGEDGGNFVAASWISPDGTVQPYENDGPTMTPARISDVQGREVPTAWRIVHPERELDITVTAILEDAWMATSQSYWEGPVRISGSHGGRGYLEMTGY